MQVWEKRIVWIGCIKCEIPTIIENIVMVSKCVLAWVCAKKATCTRLACACDVNWCKLDHYFKWFFPVPYFPSDLLQVSLIYSEKNMAIGMSPLNAFTECRSLSLRNIEFLLWNYFRLSTYPTVNILWRILHSLWFLCYNGHGLCAWYCSASLNHCRMYVARSEMWRSFLSQTLNWKLKLKFSEYDISSLSLSLFIPFSLWLQYKTKTENKHTKFKSKLLRWKTVWSLKNVSGLIITRARLV